MTNQAVVAPTTSGSPKTTDSENCSTVATTDSTTETDNPSITEEDWSQYIANGDVESTTNPWNSENRQDHSFSYYDTVLVPLSAKSGTSSASNADIRKESEPQSHSVVMEIRCMKSLTPLDMLDLSNGLSDATGNRIWMGAVFFLECMVRQIFFQAKENAATKLAVQCFQEEQQKRELLKLRAKLFHKKRVLELGSGTGAALIAIGLAGAWNEESSSSFEEKDQDETFTESKVQPASLIFTDNDANVLSLCKMNCDQNLLKIPENSRVDYSVGKLDWGHFYNHRKANKDPDPVDLQQPFFLDSDVLRGTLDTVVATDVIYDVASIPLLMATAEGLLREGGFFVLAHVPRASIDCELSMIRESLEELILQEAKTFGFGIDICNSENDSNSCKLLFGGGGVNDETSRITRASILRPSRIAQIWTKEKNDYQNDDSQNLEKNRHKPVLSVSSDYDYDELESCGASIMIFVKKRPTNSS